MAGQLAWIALGSNQGPSRRLMAEAVAALEELPNSSVEAVSSLYRTPPWGDTKQADFLNAVVRLRTGLAPVELLRVLLDIEDRLGRDRSGGRRWGPRRMDLDLLLHGDARLCTETLTLPHPRMHERAFVLVPLAELDANLEIPGHGTVAACLSTAGREGIVEEAPAGWAAQ